MPSQFSLTHALRRIGLAPWFAVGVVAVGLLVNALHSVIDNLVRNTLGIASPVWGTLATFGVVVLIGAAVVMLVAVLAPPPRLRSPLSPQSGEAPPPKKRGLILLVSNHPESALFAIRYHLIDGPLERVWLIPSHGHDAAYFGPGTALVAEEIKKQAEGLAAQHGRGLAVVIDRRGVSPANAQETYDCVRQLFRHGHLPPGDMIADFTGATKPMTLGMIMACMTPERDMEYVSLHPPTKTMHGPFRIEYRLAAFDLKHEAE